jgi:probable selenium-dependent hydroxylase accessory protein YqeC
MNLRESLGIRHKEIISIVGGGGKTTVMFGLAKELAHNGSCVITTTTTRILAPSLGTTEKLIIEKRDEVLLRRVTLDMCNYRHLTVASEGNATGKLIGITPGTAISLAGLEGVSHLIVEADGAARRPLKAPRDYEPVIPDNTTLVIAVAGIDALEGRLEEENVFRSALAASLLQTPLGTAVSAEMMAKLITCPGGIPKGAPAHALIVPFINKMDLDGGIEKGRQVARSIMAQNHPQIPFVLLGQARCPDPVVEVVCREA